MSPAPIRNVLLGILLAFGSAPACLPAQTFANRLPWSTGVSSVTGTLDFEGLTPQTGAIWGPFMLSGAFISADAPNSLSILRPTWHPTYTDWGTGDVLHWENHGIPGAPATARFVLPSSVTALGFDFADATASQVSVTLSTGDVYSFTGSAQPGPPGSHRAPEFWGVISGSAFNWIEISYTDADPAGLAMFDNFSWGIGAVTTVPEPASFVLTLFALVVVGMLWRSRTQSRRCAS